MEQASRLIYSFGPFQLDPSERRLLCNGRYLRLPPKVFETLVVLVERHGLLVERDDIMNALWPGEFVEEVTLARNISLLRKALGDAPGQDESQYIETVSKRGYRFIASVTEGVPAAASPGGLQEAEALNGAQSAPSKNGWQNRQAWIALPRLTLLLGGTKGAPVVTGRGPRAVRIGWGAAGVLLGALAAIGMVRFRQKPSAPADSVRFQIALPDKTLFVTDLDLSPDGRHLVIGVMKQDGPPQLWIRDLDSLESRLLPGTDGASSAFWSPDSRSLAFESEGKLKREDISGGVPQTICAVDSVGPGAWSRDGIIVFGASQGLMKVSSAGGNPSILVKVRRSLDENGIEITSFLPDGRHFLYVRSTKGAVSNLATYVGSLDEHEQQASKPLISRASAFYAPMLSAGPESLFFYDGRTLMVQSFDASRLELKGDPRPVVEDVIQFGVSANVLAYIESKKTGLQLTWFDHQGRVLGTVGDPGIHPHPAISPDGRTVAVPLLDSSSKKADLWLYDLEGGRPTRLTFDGKENLRPVWSPDGGRIAFYSGDRNGPPWVYQKRVNGVGDEEAFESPAVNRSRPLDWSPDGRYLIEGVHGEKFSIWVLPLFPGQTDGERKLFPLLKGDFNVFNARLSPDGKWIAYDSDETGRDEIFVSTFPNPRGKWLASANGGTNPVWSRDGKELYYIASDGNLMAVDVKSQPDGSFYGTVPRVLFHPHAQLAHLNTFDVAKDGRFLIPAITGQVSPITVVVNWRAQASKH